MPVSTFERPETVVVKGDVRDEGGVLVTPGTSTKLTITDPAGAAVVAAQDVSWDAVGIWRYLYPPAADAVLGAYHVRATAVDSGRSSIGDFQFYLVG